jgi:hypothetical protein
MTLFGMSPAVFLVGAGAIVAGLLLLHLLRVRLRAVEVDTLLFFRLAGALQKPRVLPGKPARWLAFALALLAAMGAWGALAEPRTGLDRPSRFVVVEPDSFDAEARAGLAAEWAAEGLGPRGVVVAATLPPVRLLAAGEPVQVLESRWETLRTLHSPLGERHALQAVADASLPQDQVVWIGAAAPATTRPVVHVPTGSTPGTALRQVRWQRSAGGMLSLVLRLDGDGLTAELRHGESVLAKAAAPAGVGELTLGPVQPPVGATALQCVIAGAEAPLTVPLPTLAPRRVHIAADIPAELTTAIAAVVDADPELRLDPDAATAEIVVASADDGVDARPRLVLTPGVGVAPRMAVATAEAPLACSLRDKRRRAAEALPPLENSRIWIADAESGEALVAATVATGATSAPPQLRVFVVEWLLQPVSHADVPLLLATALRALGDVPELHFAVAGQPVAAPAAFPPFLRAGAILPVGGVVSVAADTEFAVQLAATPTAAAEVPRESLGGAGRWAPVLLLLLVVLLAVDAILFHRGRLP